MPPPTAQPDVQTVLADDNFKSLPLPEKHQVLMTIDPNYAGLPPKERAAALSAIHYGPAPTPESSSEPNSVAGGFLRHGIDAVKGAYKMVTSPPTTTGEKIADATGPGGLPLYRLAAGQVDAEKTAGGQLADQAKSAVGAARQGDYKAAATQGTRAAVTGASMLDPLATGPVASANKLQDEGRQKEAIGGGALDAGLLATPFAKDGMEALDERNIPANIEAGKSGILKVLKPKPGAGGAAADALEKSVHTAVDEGDLPKIFRETPLKGKGAAVMGDAIDKIDSYQDDLWESGHKAPIGRHATETFDPTPVQQQALSAIDDASERASVPGQAARARRWVQNAFRPGMTLKTADDMIRSLNAEMKGDTPEAWGNVGARVRMEALKALRDGVDNHLENPLSGPPEIGVRNVNTRWGALQAIKERLGERYWSEWQKQAVKEGSPVPAWMRAYAFAHPGGVAVVAGARLTGSMLAPSDADVFASSAKNLAKTRIEPRPTGQVGMVGRLPKGPTP